MCSLVFSVAAIVKAERLSFEAVFCFSYKHFLFERLSFNSCCKVRFDSQTVTVLAVSTGTVLVLVL